MIDLGSDQGASFQATSVVLDCGADEASLCAGDISIKRGAIQMALPWWFAPGTCLVMTLKSPQEGSLVEAETLVVDTEPCHEREGRFLTTLLVLRSSPTYSNCSCAQEWSSSADAIELCSLL